MRLIILVGTYGRRIVPLDPQRASWQQINSLVALSRKRSN